MPLSQLYEKFRFFIHLLPKLFGYVIDCSVKISLCLSVETGIYGIVSTFSSDGLPVTGAKQLIRLNKFEKLKSHIKCLMDHRFHQTHCYNL
jgi:hypothetical protein